MAVILNVETATKNCSVGVAKNGQTLAVVEAAADQYIHSEKLHQFIKQCLEKASVSFADLDAIAVSNGPGSYTGLRIGVSAAKGLCYALNIPLIALNTNDVLANAAPLNTMQTHLLTVIDARRNEVFARVYNAEQHPETDIEAVVLEPGMYKHLSPLTVVGDAAQKTAQLLEHPQLEAVHCFPSATHMAALSAEKFKASNFANLAYHEPYYLKDFVAGKPKKLL